MLRKKKVRIAPQIVDDTYADIPCETRVLADSINFSEVTMAASQVRGSMIVLC